MLNVLSGFDRRNCYISVLAWNNGTVEGNALINISHVPYDNFHVEVFRLDEDHMPGVNRCLARLLTRQSDKEFLFSPPIFLLLSCMQVSAVAYMIPSLQAARGSSGLCPCGSANGHVQSWCMQATSWTTAR